MTYYLPSNNQPDGPRGDTRIIVASGNAMEDLKIFWGPEICRLEYLLHLLDTGRIVDECAVKQA